MTSESKSSEPCGSAKLGKGEGCIRLYERVELFRAIDLDMRDVVYGVCEVEVLEGWRCYGCDECQHSEIADI